MLVVVLVVAAANVVNDLRDAEADLLGNPGRAIPSGRVTHRDAGRLWVGLCAAGCLLAISFQDVALAVMAASCVAAGVVYSYRLKNTVLVGNAFVGLLAGTPVLYGSLTAGSPTASTWLAALLIFLFIFGDEVLKAVDDREADHAAGLRTVATALDVRSGLRVFRAIALCFVAATALPIALNRAGVLYGIGIMVGAVLPTLRNVWLLGSRPEAESICAALRLSKAVWFTGMWALWFLG